MLVLLVVVLLLLLVLPNPLQIRVLKMQVLRLHVMKHPQRRLRLRLPLVVVQKTPFLRLRLPLLVMQNPPFLRLRLPLLYEQRCTRRLLDHDRQRQQGRTRAVLLLHFLLRRRWRIMRLRWWCDVQALRNCLQQLCLLLLLLRLLLQKLLDAKQNLHLLLTCATIVSGTSVRGLD